MRAGPSMAWDFPSIVLYVCGRAFRGGMYSRVSVFALPCPAPTRYCDLGTIKMRRKSPPWKINPRRLAGSQSAQSAPKNRKHKSLPTNLSPVGQDALSKMRPGDIFLLATAGSLRRAIEPVFFAVIACPSCGTRSLITSPQYFGSIPIVCSSQLCSCRFRIENRDCLVYLASS